jgi:hypothetical protein
MSSARHEILVEFLRAHPRLVPTLACQALGQNRPGRATVGDAGFSQAVPPPRSADLVLELGPHAPWRGIIVEVQLGRSARKRLVWPLYAAALRARLGGPVLLVVVSPQAGVAAWARRPIVLGQPGSDFIPFVLGPEAIPRITSVREAARHPGLAVLSTFAHGNEPGGEHVALAARAALRPPTSRRRATRSLDQKPLVDYAVLIGAALDQATRRKLEALMQSRGFPIPNWARPEYLRGLNEGKAEGKAEGLLAILTLRGLEVTAAERARILATTDLATIERWFDRAPTARSTAAVLGPRPRGHRSARPRASRVRQPAARPTHTGRRRKP